MSKKITYEEILEYLQCLDTNTRILTTKEEFDNELVRQNKSPLYVDLKYECECGKCFIRRFSTIKKNNKLLCKECMLKDRKINRLNLKEVKEIIKSVNLEYVKGDYRNHDTKIIVRCQCGNEFETTLRIIKNHIKNTNTDSYCKECLKHMARERYAYTIEEVRKKIESMDIVLLTNEYINSHSKLKVIGKCGHEFETTFDVILRGHSGYCKKCVNANERAYNWNGGYDLENEKFRKTYEFKEFRKNVLKRDMYTCVCCGKQKGELNVHHLDGYNWCKEKRTDVNNGVCLCEDCHKLFHSIYGNGFNTKEQFYNFMIFFLK